MQSEQTENEFSEQLSQLKLTLSVMKYALVVVIFILIFLIGILSVHSFNRTQFVTFDIKGTTNTFLEQVSALSLNEEQKKVMVSRYQKAISSVIAEYAEDNMIVLVRGAVVSDVGDKTHEIKAKIAEKMKLSQ